MILINRVLVIAVCALLMSCTATKELSSDVALLSSDVVLLKDQQKTSQQDIACLQKLVNNLSNENVWLKNRIVALERDLLQLEGEVEQVRDTVFVICNHYAQSSRSNQSTTTRYVTTPKQSTNRSTVRAVSSGRCQAITKKGTRCKRNASPGSRFCWQHQ